MLVIYGISDLRIINKNMEILVDDIYQFCPSSMVNGSKFALASDPGSSQRKKG